jgi:hypothetical protein
MKRIYLKLIDEPPLNGGINVDGVKNAVERIVEIEWEIEPKPDNRSGGYSMSGFIPDNTDYEDMIQRLINCGYRAVI